MKRIILLSLFLSTIAFSQQANFQLLKVGDSATINPSAALEVKSTVGAILVPRMTTTQKNAISSPTNGDLIYDTTLGQFSGYQGGSWSSIGGGGGTWGSITGTLSSQSDLYSYLNSKVPNVLTTTGDLIISSGGSTASRLGVGSGSSVLSVSGGLPSWQPFATPSYPISLANGGFGVSNGSSTAAFNSISPFSTPGDILYENASYLPSRLGIGSSTNLLTVSGGLPAWEAIPTWNQNTTGTASNITASSNTSLTSISNLVTVGTIGTGVWQGTSVAVAYGGTGNNVAGNQYGVPYFNTTTQLSSTAAGTNHYPLVANSSSAPTWQQLGLTTGVTGVLPLINGGTNVAAGSSLAALNGISPMSTTGDLLYEINPATGASRLGIGSSNSVLTVNSGEPQWNPVTLSSSNAVTGQLPLANGGTSINAGSTTALFTGLSPTTTAGDILYEASPATGVTRLGIGSGNDVLTVVGGIPAWQAAPATSPLNTKGDIYTYTSTNARQGVPGDYGRLVPDAAQSSGWRSANYLQIQDGRPGKNYVQYADFNNQATTGWSLGNIPTITNGLPASNSPTFGSGANGNLSISANTSSPIAGLGNLSYSSSSATTAGDMVATSSLALDTEDQAKVLTVKFYYTPFTNPTNANWSGTSSNSYAWAVWDVTNSVWLSTAGQFCMTQSTGIGYCTGTFQTNATTANIRFVLYNSAATSGALNLYLDDFFVGPQTAPMGPAMGDWVAYTPTFVALGSVTNVVTYSRRVGDSLQVVGVLTAGTATASTASMTLGYNGINGNVTIDSNKISSSFYTLIGYAGNSNAAGGGAETVIAEGGATTAAFGNCTATPGCLVPAAGNALTGSPQTFSFSFTVPIAGWSSNTSMSSDTDTRVVAARMTGATASLTASYTDVTWTTIVNDTHGAMGAINYTIPVTGYYDISGQIYFAGTQALNGTTDISLFNTTTSSTLLESQNVYAGAVTGNNASAFAFQSVLLNAGTQIKIQAKSSATLPVITSSATENYLSIKRVTGPSVISATESVYARYHGSSSILSSNLGTISYTTKDFDSHGAYASGIYTCPVSGKYHVDAGLLATAATVATTTTNTFAILLAGASVSYVKNWPNTAATSKPVSLLLSDMVSCAAGQTVCIQALSNGTTPSITSDNNANYFSISLVH